MSRLLSIALLLVAATISKADQKDSVVAAAGDRQGITKSLVLEYRQQSRRTLTATATRPASEMSTTANNRVVFDGKKIRVEDNNPISAREQGFLNHQQVDVFDGVDSFTHFPAGIAPDRTPSGIRRARAPKLDVSIPLPVFMHFRGLDDSIPHRTAGELKPTGRLELIDATCLEYAPGYWFDSTEGFILRRYESKNNDRVHSRTNIAYREDPALGWVPTGWKREDLNDDGSTKHVQECEVTKIVLNGPIAADEFEPAFKPGTNVSDQAEMKEFRVQADGTLRELTSAEIFGTQPRATFSQRIARNGWTIVLVLSVFLLLLLPVLIRRRTRPTAVQTN